MTEKAKLRVYETKKGAFAATVEFASGKSMPLPPWYEVGREHDGLECEVEREKGRIISVRVRGEELPRRAEGRSAAGPTGGKPRLPGPGGELPARRAGRLTLSRFLPQDTTKALQNVEPDNLGLYLQKLALQHSGGEEAHFSFPPVRISVGPPWTPAADFFDRLDKRRREALEASSLEFRRVAVGLRGRLVVGLGADSVYEVSLALHPLYGFPYVPASAVKGVVRSVAIAEDFGGQEDRARADTLFCLVFGTEDRRGVVRFFDAYPLDRLTVTRDVINPHYAPYYQGEDLPPGDYYHPVPVFLGCVEEARLVLYVALGKDVLKYLGAEPLDRALRWLTRALSLYGIGAKTSAGYGLMEVLEEGVRP